MSSANHMTQAQQATYEAWRISYQSSEQAARAAYRMWQELEAQAQAVPTDNVSNASSTAPDAPVQAIPVGWIDADTLEAMKKTPASAKTRWPIYRLSEWHEKDGTTALYLHPAVPVRQPLKKLLEATP